MNTTSTSYFMKTLPAFSLLTAALALSSATVVRAATVSNWLALTITNPTPAAYENFGYSVTSVGTNGVLIGADRDQTGALDSGAAYLFSTGGTLITAFTNPTPAYNDNFGTSLAALGTDRVLIGTPNADMGAVAAGTAYLFSTNGTLLTVFTNPTPAYNDFFGRSVAAVGSDRVLVGAIGDDTGGTDVGAAYLFNTNGVLLASFISPPTLPAGDFGSSLAVVGGDQLVIGEPHVNPIVFASGAAYLFNTNGVLTATFTNPSPVAGDWFGFSVAAVGTERVLIGAPYKSAGAGLTGAAYLFSTNGALINAFTNPTPEYADMFGISVAAVGTDWVLIGAGQDDTGAADAGAAYLFSTNGVLLATFSKTTPASGDAFGDCVAALGINTVLIGAHWDNAGARATGAAYLFSLETLTSPAPSLSINRNPSLSTLTISWPAPAAWWLLEGTNALPSVPASSWPPVPPPYQTNAGTISVMITNQPATGNQFFRLRQP